MPEQGTSTPQVVSDATLSDAGGATIQAPWGAAFDSSGTLWTTNSATSTVTSFASASLVTGAPTPMATLSATQVNSVATLDQPHGICIDDVGNVAVVNSNGSSGIAVFAPSQHSTGSPTPSTFIVGDATTLNAPQGCAFGPTVG
jgi:sugar lactone lactonase YvrE